MPGDAGGVAGPRDLPQLLGLSSRGEVHRVQLLAAPTVTGEDEKDRPGRDFGDKLLKGP